jgi:hypothetical protein
VVRVLKDEDICWKAYVGVTGRGISLDIGCRTEISRKKTVLRTKILQTLTVHIKLRVSHPDVFEDRIKTVKHNLFVLVVEFTWATCFDLA